MYTIIDKYRKDRFDAGFRSGGHEGRQQIRLKLAEISLCGERDIIEPDLQKRLIILYREDSEESAVENVRDDGWDIERSELREGLSYSDDIKTLYSFVLTKSAAAAAIGNFEGTISSDILFDTQKLESIMASLKSYIRKEVETVCADKYLYYNAMRVQANAVLLCNYSVVSNDNKKGKIQFSAEDKKIIFDYVNKNINTIISLSGLSLELKMNIYKFSRIFRATFDMPPHAWLMLQRVSRAKYQIESGRFPLKSIAADAGFFDQSHMTRIFLQSMGVTPGEYKASVRVSGGH